MRASSNEYLTVSEAAELLRVSVSTVRRWIREGSLGAHRAGRRRVLVKRDELIQSVRTVEPASIAITRVANATAAGPNPDQVRPLTPAAQEEGLRALERLKELAAHERERQEASGIMSPESWEVIREAREMRTEQLMGEHDPDFEEFDIGVLADMIVHSPDRPRRRRLTEDEQRQWFVALERAQRTSDRIQQRSGVDTFPPSEDIVAEMREERLRQLTGENDDPDGIEA